MWPYSETNDFAITNCLFRAAELTENVDADKYSYSGYGIGFEVRLFCSLSDGSRFVHRDTSIIKKDNLILGKGPVQWLDDTTLTAKAEYSINFVELGIIFFLSLHCNGSNSFLFNNGVKIINVKQKIQK